MSRQWNYGCMFPGSSCHTWKVTNGNILYLIFFSYSTHINVTVACFLILCIVIVHAKKIQNCFLCCFGMYDVACIFIRQHADRGVGNSSSSPYTLPSAHVISIHYPSHSSSFIIIFIPLSCVPSFTQSYQHLSLSGGQAY